MTVRRGLALALAALAAAAAAVTRAEETETRWLVGDLHVHVSPPDVAGHSALTVATAVERARASGLDFVVLTPHQRDTAQVRELALAAATDPPGPLVVAGWEFTRDRPGHLGIAFVEVSKLGEDPARAALAAGGLVVVNHPFLGPVESHHPLMKRLRTDRRWRPFAEGTPGESFNGIEVWHERSALIERMHRAQAAELPDTQMIRKALAAWDRVTLTGKRRIVGVGGSDAHGKLPYCIAPLPCTSVLVRTADEKGLREGLLRAHVTFGLKGGVDCRSLAATSDVPGERAGIGDSLRAKEKVVLVWDGEARLTESGIDVGVFDGGTTRRLPEPGAFAFWRIEKVGEQFSNMVYANLPE